MNNKLELRADDGIVLVWRMLATPELHLPDVLFPSHLAWTTQVGAEPARSEDEAKSAVDVRMTAHP